MDRATKETLKVVLPILGGMMIALGTAAGMKKYSKRDKFKAGDCVATIYKNEFERSIYYHKILKVGEEMYLVNKKGEKSTYYQAVEGTESKSYLNKYGKVDKKLCIAKVYE